MKKSVIILILIVYIASIAFVGFFGMKMLSYNEVIVAEKVECINDDMTEVEEVSTDASGNPITIKLKTITLYYTEGLTYQLYTKVYPENARQDVVYEYTSTIATVNEQGTVSFTKRGTIHITISCSEYRTVNTLVRIIVRKAN